MRTRGLDRDQTAAAGSRRPGPARTLARAWDDVLADWAESPPRRLWRAHSDAVNARLLARWLPARSVPRLLKTDLFDEAVSEGLYPLLARRADRVTGIDVSERAVTAAAARHPALDAQQADVRALPFRKDEFDAVISNSTLDHFRSPDQLAAGVAELHRVLRSGGLLLLTLDNRANPLVALRNALPFPWLKRLGLVPYYVGATHGPRGGRRVLQEAGFQVRACTSVLHVPRVVAVAATRWLERNATSGTKEAFLRLLMQFERLERWPTGFLTGYFVAYRAVKPPTSSRASRG